MTEFPIDAVGGPGRPKELLKGPTASRTKPAAIGLVHRQLRAATRETHASIDRMLLRFDLNKTEDYGTFLNVHFAALLTVQSSWRPQDEGDFGRMLRCLQADLETLGFEATVPQPASQPASPSRGLGIGYVVRGSRLGAAVLRRGIVSQLPTCYLDFLPTLSWPTFLIDLESIAEDSNGKDAACRAARSTFDSFAMGFNSVQGADSKPPRE